jgi:hypothetical protein
MPTLQSTLTLRLRIEQVDDWQERKIKDSKDDVCLPANVADRWWRDLNNHVVTQPVD